MKPYSVTRSLLLLLSLIIGMTFAVTALAAAVAGAYTLDWFTIGNGGGSASGGAYQLDSTIGQSMAGTLQGGAYQLHVGYWPEIVSAAPLSPTLDLAKSASTRIASPGQNVAFTLTLTVTGQAPIPVILTDTLPSSMSYVAGSATGGAAYNASTGQIQFNASITPGVPTLITYAATVNANVLPGSLLANNAAVTYLVNDASYHLQRTVAVSVPNSAPFHTLTLIYANGDGNLSSRMTELLNRAERSAANPNSVVLMLLDGPTDDDARLYRLQSDFVDGCPNYQNPTCNGLYVLGQNYWVWSDDIASAYSLSELLQGAINAYPNASQVIISLVGHGSGWYPDALLGQPSAWDGQPGGLLWDTHPHNYLTTKALGDALRWSYQATGAKINLVYLDACLMAMSEVAYELSDSVNYLLAAENWTWTSFPYDAYLDQSVINGTDNAAQIGAAWLSIQANLLRTNSYPFALSLIDQSQMGVVRSAVEGLASAVEATLPADSGKLLAAQTPEVCFDSNQDTYIDTSDNYCDLYGFASNLAVQYAANPTVITAANTVQTAVAAAVLIEDYQSGVPYINPNAQWDWQNLGGLSLYTPFHEDDWKRGFYNGNHLRFAQNGQWGGLLNTFWNAAPPAPSCTSNCEPPPPIEIAPISAQAQAGQDYIQINWQLDQPVKDLAGYHVMRQITGTSFITLTTTTINSTQFVDASNLAIGTDYCYQVRGVNTGGVVLAQSGITCARFGELMLWVPHINAPAGSTNVVVPINLAQAAGLCIGALDVTVSYNQSIAVANGQVSPTIFTEGYAYTANTSVPGQVHIAAITSTCAPLYGPGTLFTIGFDTVGTSGQSSAIDFITGLTYTAIYDDSNLLDPVPLSLTSGSLTLSAAYIRGDVNGDTVVNAADSLMALRIASGQITPTPQQLGACDVNGDGACTAADATIIRCYSTTGSWISCGTATLLNLPDGLKSSAQSPTVRLGLITIEAGQSITVTMKINDGPEFAGGTFSFLYDPTQMTFDRATLSSLTAGFGIQATVIQPGLVRVAMARNTPIGADGSLLSLRFNVMGKIAPVSIVDARLNDGYGRDFVTSVLQKQIQIITWRSVFLPLMRH